MADRAERADQRHQRDADRGALKPARRLRAGRTHRLPQPQLRRVRRGE
ncbi:hypothetical protein AB5I41_15330 [Sphingomonas sp. MMS24-JH45]